MRTLILFALCGALLFPFAGAASFDEGLKAYDAGKYSLALEKFKEEAEAGDLAAMRNLGQMYRLGRGVKADNEEAFRWFKRAAEGGFDQAQYSLALMYLGGFGTKKDQDQAVFWLQTSHQAGFPPATQKLQELSIQPTFGKTQAEADFLEKLKKNKDPAATVRSTLSHPPQDGTAGKKPAPAKAAAPATAAAAPPSAAKVSTPSSVGESSLKPLKSKEKAAEKATDAAEGKAKAHLASYQTQEKLETGWDVLVRSYPVLKTLRREEMETEIPGKGTFIRLYVSGNTSKIKELCEDMHAKKAYCAMQVTSP